MKTVIEEMKKSDNKDIPAEQTKVYEITLMKKTEGGEWEKVTGKNFPQNGLTITIPYPNGTGRNSHNFIVLHMITEGDKAGTIEKPSITKTADGIRFKVSSLSPISVAWTEAPRHSSDDGAVVIPEKPALPEYVITGGNWTDNNGSWTYNNGRDYKNEWAAIENPYADESKGQSRYDWFRFDANGVMMTGWYRDEDNKWFYLNPISDGTRGSMRTGWILVDGTWYYLNPVSDGNRGMMFTGWQWIKGADGKERCYYLNPVSDGTRGRLYVNTMTPVFFKNIINFINKCIIFFSCDCSFI